MLYKIASIRRDADLPCFVTLTYPDAFPTVQRAKRDLKVYLQRLAREFPGSGWIWKLEPQQRGAPHYHLLVWGVDVGDLLSWTIKTWYEIAGNGDRNHYLFHAGQLGNKPCVQLVRSFRGVWSYASKYLGKTFEVAEWGSQWTGRFWGIGRPKNIPFGASQVLYLGRCEVVGVMRYQRRFSGLKRAHGNSLTIFCDVDQWIDKMSPTWVLSSDKSSWVRSPGALAP
jgi:hypothetical protein